MIRSSNSAQVGLTCFVALATVLLFGAGANRAVAWQSGEERTIIASASLNNPLRPTQVEQAFQSAEALQKFIETDAQPQIRPFEIAGTKKTAAEALAELKQSPDKIDFERHTVVVVYAGRRNELGAKITIDSADVPAGSDTLVIHYTYHPYFGGAAPPMVTNNPGALAIVNGTARKVEFRRTVKQWPKGLPLPPSAPPGGIPR